MNILILSLKHILLCLKCGTNAGLGEQAWHERQSIGVSSHAAGLCAKRQFLPLQSSQLQCHCPGLAAQHQSPFNTSLLTAVASTGSADTAAEVDAFGDEQWERVARMGLPGRSGAECAAQWATRVRPGTYLGDWTADEDARLTQLAKRHKRANVRGLPGLTNHKSIVGSIC